MYKYDGDPIPEITRHMTPTEAEGIRNAHELRKYVEEGLKTDTLPMYHGELNRKKLASNVGFGRSAYQQNPHIKNITEWTEKQLGQKPKKGGSGAGSTDKEKELAVEVSRLQNRNISLKTELADSEKELKELRHKQKILDNVDPRLPW